MQVFFYVYLPPTFPRVFLFFFSHLNSYLILFFTVLLSIIRCTCPAHSISFDLSNYISSPKILSTSSFVRNLQLPPSLWYHEYFAITEPFYNKSTKKMLSEVTIGGDVYKRQVLTYFKYISTIPFLLKNSRFN